MRHQNEENLLEGVMMTASISCTNQDTSMQFGLDGYEGRSFTIGQGQQEFQLSSNESDRPVFQLSANYNLSANSQFGKKFHLTNSMKKNNHGGKDYVQTRLKGDRKWQTILDLDSKLVQLNYSGILEQMNGFVNKLAQIILTEQYCKYRLYEKKLVQLLKDLLFSINEFQRQKKSLLSQIQLLKNDNSHLRDTVDVLATMIKQMQNSVENYFASLEQKTADKQNIDQSEIMRKSNQQIQVPFAGKFMHSVDEVSFSMIIEKERETVQFIRIQDYAEFIYQIKQKCDKILNPGGESIPTKLYLPIVDRFRKQSVIRDWTISVISSLYQLEHGSNSSDGTVSKHYFYPSQRQQKIIQKYLGVLAENRQALIKNINDSHQKQLQFWFIIHSACTTFLGIMVNETKHCYLQLSFNDQTKYWINQFKKEITAIKQLCSIDLTEEREQYWNKCLLMLSDMNELMVFRMLRNN